MDYNVKSHTVLHAGGALTTILPNLWQDNFITGGARSRPVFTPTHCPTFRCLSGMSSCRSICRSPIPLAASFCFLTEIPTTWPRTREVDLPRYQDDLRALTLGNQVQLLTMIGFAKNFRSGYIESFTAGVDHDFGDLRFPPHTWAPPASSWPVSIRRTALAAPILRSRRLPSSTQRVTPLQVSGRKW